MCKEVIIKTAKEAQIVKSKNGGHAIQLICYPKDFDAKLHNIGILQKQTEGFAVEIASSKTKNTIIIEAEMDNLEKIISIMYASSPPAYINKLQKDSLNAQLTEIRRKLFEAVQVVKTIDGKYAIEFLARSGDFDFKLANFDAVKTQTGYFAVFGLCKITSRENTIVIAGKINNLVGAINIIHESFGFIDKTQKNKLNSELESALQKENRKPKRLMAISSNAFFVAMKNSEKLQGVIDTRQSKIQYY